jgi:hypothetical protein
MDKTSEQNAIETLTRLNVNFSTKNNGVHLVVEGMSALSTIGQRLVNGSRVMAGKVSAYVISFHSLWACDAHLP